MYRLTVNGKAFGPLMSAKAAKAKLKDLRHSVLGLGMERVEA